MKKLLSVLMAVMLLAIPAILAVEETTPVTVETGVGIGIGVTPANSCPEITNVDYFVHTWFDHDWDCGLEDCVEGLTDFAMAAGWAGRSYAFEGEAIGFAVDVEDRDGIVDDCVKVVVTLDNGYDPVEAGCVLSSTEALIDGGIEIHPQGIGHFTCMYTVEPRESDNAYDEYWISVAVQDKTCDVDPENDCTDTAPGVISLFLNPAVSMTISSQDTFGFLYNEGGKETPAYAGTTVYSPYFTVENTAQANSGLYILLQMYGTDMWDYESSAALCPTSNILKIENVDYMANHLNVKQGWTEIEDNPNFPKYIFGPTEPVVNNKYGFDLSKFAGNFLGIGDDITMRLRLNIPSPCKGNFQDGGEIIFVGQVI